MESVSQYEYVNHQNKHYQNDDPYGFSEDYNAELKRKNITDTVTNNGFDNSNIKTEDERHLLIFIRNYDFKGRIVESPRDAEVTYIDTYERIMEHLYFRKEIKDENGNIRYEQEEQYLIKEDPYLFIEDNVKIVEPHVIQDTHFLKSFLEEYFENYPEKTGKFNKSIYVVFHNTQNYTYYNAFNKEMIDLLKVHNYHNMTFDLDNQTIEIDFPFIMEFGTFSISNAKLNIKVKTDISIKANEVYFNSVEINTTSNRTINIQAKNKVDIRYISFTKQLVYFNIQADQDDIALWINTSVFIYNFIYDSQNYDYIDKLNSIIKIENFYNVTITGAYVNGKKFDISILRLKNIMNLLMNTGKVKTSDRFIKSLISIESVSNISVCSSYAFQEREQSEKIFFFIVNQGKPNDSYSFSHIITSNLGIISVMNDFSSKISMASCETINSLLPISYLKSSIGKIVISKSSFTNSKQFLLAPGNFSIYDSILESETLELSGSKKIYISNSSVKANEIKFIVTDGASLFTETSNISGKKITISGESGKGMFKTTRTEFKTDDMDIQSINRVGCENSNFYVRNFSLIGAGISGFNPYFLKNKLDSIKIQGKINNSVITINNTVTRKLIMEVSNCIGDFNIIYNEKIPRKEITMNNTKATIAFSTLKSEDEKQDAKLTCLENCVGSIVYSTDKNIKFIPQAEGEFKDFKYFDSNYSLQDIKQQSEYKKKICYGYQ